MVAILSTLTIAMVKLGQRYKAIGRGRAAAISLERTSRLLLQHLERDFRRTARLVKDLNGARCAGSCVALELLPPVVGREAGHAGHVMYALAPEERGVVRRTVLNKGEKPPPGGGIIVATGVEEISFTDDPKRNLVEVRLKLAWELSGVRHELETETTYHLAQAR